MLGRLEVQLGQAMGEESEKRRARRHAGCGQIHLRPHLRALLAPAVPGFRQIPGTPSRKTYLEDHRRKWGKRFSGTRIPDPPQARAAPVPRDRLGRWDDLRSREPRLREGLGPSRRVEGSCRDACAKALGGTRKRTPSAPRGLRERRGARPTLGRALRPARSVLRRSGGGPRLRFQRHRCDAAATRHLREAPRTPRISTRDSVHHRPRNGAAAGPGSEHSPGTFAFGTSLGALRTARSTSTSDTSTAPRSARASLRTTP